MSVTRSTPYPFGQSASVKSPEANLQDGAAPLLVSPVQGVAAPSPNFAIIPGTNGDNSLTGTSGSDQIFGGDGNDTLYGGAGDDLLFGGEDVDTVFGGTGDDIFAGALAYKDVIDGGDGIDTLDLSASTADYAILNDFVLDIDRGVSINNGITFLDGDYSNLENVISFDYIAIEIIGNAADNILTSSNYEDTIRGEDGNDILFGRGGVDRLYGDAGNDTLFGGLGTDSLYGGNDDDVLIMLDGTGPDHLFGGNGDDTADFRDNPGDAMVFDTTAKTYAFAEGGTTYILSSIEVIWAGTGDDTFWGTDAFRLTVDGGAGSDTIDFSAGFYDLSDFGKWVVDIDQGFSVNSGTSFIYGDYTNLENVVSFDKVAVKLIGNSADNTLTASVYDDEVMGELGDDVILGRDGNDRLFGGDGYDSVYGGVGDDTLDGGGGVDHLFGESGIDAIAGGGGADFVNGGGGNDSLNGGGGNDLIVGGGGNDTLIGGSGIDTLRGSDGADSLNGGSGIDTLSYSSDVTGVVVNLASNTATGGEADGDTIVNFEQVIGGSGNDDLRGDDGDNALIGGAGEDNIIGGLGNDRLVGGDGDDTIRGDEGADRLRGGRGEDTLIYTTDTTGVRIDLQTNTASGGHAQGDDIGAFENVYGGSGNDDLRGTGKANDLRGKDGDDVLFGRGGDDVIFGGAGEDRINSGTGNDTIAGGGGADVFEFVAGDGDDVITDFLIGGDTIQIAGMTAADVQFSTSGNDTLITLASGDTILVENTTVAQLGTFNDFDFV